MREILNGTEAAHSFVLNPHKWYFTPMDLSVLYTSRPDVLRRAFSLSAEYLTTAHDANAVNFMDYGVPLGRRFRSLKLWFVFRYFGREGIAALIRGHLGYAKRLAQHVDEDERFELAAPVPLALVCFRLRGSDEQNRRLLDRINASGEAFLSHTSLNGAFVLRLAYGSLRTSAEDVDLVWRRIQREASHLLSA
jgi:aromatic-L-amino-acid decarboxylase